MLVCWRFRVTRCTSEGCVLRLEETAVARKLVPRADNALPEAGDADDKDNTEDYLTPRTCAGGELIFQGDNQERADDRAVKCPEPANERYQDNFARHGPVHIAQGCKLE